MKVLIEQTKPFYKNYGYVAEENTLEKVQEKANKFIRDTFSYDTTVQLAVSYFDDDECIGGYKYIVG